MGNRAGGRKQIKAYGDPYMSQYGSGYGPVGPSGLNGYGGNYGSPYGGGYGASYPQYTITTDPVVVERPWQETDWEEFYVPTVAPVGGRMKRPVIYIAAPLPAQNQFSGFGGGFGGMPMSGGFGGMPMSGGFGGMPMSGGFGGMPMSGGFGGMPMSGGFGGMPMSGGFGGMPMSGGFGGGMAGANLGYQALPMMTIAYGGGIPGVGGVNPMGGFGGGTNSLGGFGSGVPLY